MGTDRAPGREPERVPTPPALRNPNTMGPGVPHPGFRSWGDCWPAFAGAHADWLKRHSELDPIYALPECVTTHLSESTKAIPGKRIRAKKAIIEARDTDAERAFLKLCRDWGPDTVGVWMDRPIQYQLLLQTEASFDFPTELRESFCEENNISLKQLEAGLAACKARLDPAAHQMLGFAGRLTFDKQYRGDLAALKGMWDRLQQKPSLAVGSATLLRAATPASHVTQREILPEEVARFYDAYGQFIKKWELNGLVTWDLPSPQGPLEGISAGSVAHLRGSDSSVVYYPAYYDVSSRENLRDIIRAAQKRAGRDAGIEMKFPVTNTSARRESRKAGSKKESPATKTSPQRYSPSTYELALRMWLIEETVTRRYGHPHGLAARLQAAFQAQFDLSDARVKELRNHYLPYLTT
jgi:hypothetical protein